ncbi:DUF58 domain-containing protein [Rhodoferax saidenbachensis]|uniref:Uncharacterized protein n=1 Tax=Rhodoferax saidenbachensis TaxID=1484693 RepID=A0A1P8KBF8_9BURK|nr:DUF58 domain-containing protein [Rhodoferax saidenbachensis]APW43357.1 hypothetical protein RS694_13005 [Rhodoferax saidenbachensis]
MNTATVRPAPVEGFALHQASADSARTDKEAGQTTRAWLHPIRYVRGRIQRFWNSRLTPRDSTTLTQRNVYILPTRPGWMMALTLLVLLVASINYQLNLGYVLTFLLTGSAVIGMHVCHGTLRGITMNLVAPDAQFVGSSVPISINLVSDRKSIRYGIGLAVWGNEHWSWTDVPAQGSAKVHVSFTPTHRGLHPLPTLTAETRFPLGTFRVWTVWRPAAQALVYPAPEAHPPPLPPGEPRAGGASTVQRHDTGEFDGVRAYRRGDPLKLVVWKKVAKADELVSRDAQQVQRLELWLDLNHTGLAGGTQASLEARLSRLCAWVLLAEKQGLRYGMRLGGRDIAPDSGEAHKRNCLQALAIY